MDSQIPRAPRERKKESRHRRRRERERRRGTQADRQPASQPVEIRDFAGGDPDPMIHIPWFPGAEMTSSNVFGYVCSRHLSPQPAFLPKHVTWKILWKSSFLCWGNEQVFVCLFVLWFGFCFGDIIVVVIIHKPNLAKFGY
jgi:hypothetical protein